VPTQQPDDYKKRESGHRTEAEIVEMYDGACRAKTPEEARFWHKEVWMDWCYEHPDLEANVCQDMARKAICYWAGYFNHEVRLRVEKLYAEQHPVFGPATRGPIDPTQALLMGLAPEGDAFPWPRRPPPWPAEP